MEIANIEYKNGDFRLCLDKVPDSNDEFRFVWRGTKVSKDGFINRPAYFDWETLGKLLRKSFTSGKITEDEISSFLNNFIGLND